jgi:hypothetical protein
MNELAPEDLLAIPTPLNFRIFMSSFLDHYFYPVLIMTGGPGTRDADEIRALVKYLLEKTESIKDPLQRKNIQKYISGNMTTRPKLRNWDTFQTLTLEEHAILRMLGEHAFEDQGIFWASQIQREIRNGLNQKIQLMEFVVARDGEKNPAALRDLRRYRAERGENSPGIVERCAQAFTGIRASWKSLTQYFRL